MFRPTRTHARLITIAVTLGAVVASGAVIWQASYSAFSATTANPSSTWSAGNVALSDDDAGTALFNTSNAAALKPGATSTKCIDVTSSGSLASTVKMYSSNWAQTNSLGASMYLTVALGAPNVTCTDFAASKGSTNVYGGTLAALGTTNTGFSTGLGTWAPTGGTSETRAYSFTYTLDINAPSSAQGGTAQLGFTWESQNS